MTAETTLSTVQTVRGVLPKAAARRGRGLLLAAGWVGGAALFAAAWWVLNLALPHKLTLTLLGHVLQLGKPSAGLNRATEGLMLIGFLAAPLVLAVETIVLGWSGSSLYKLVHDDSASERSDLVWYALANLRCAEILAILFTLGLAAVSGDWVHRALERATGASLSMAGLPLALQIAGFYVAYGFLDYWTHRFKHGRYLWPLHRFHHSATTFCVLTSDRVHPADHWSRFATVGLVQVFLGVPMGVVIGIGLFERVMQYARHSRLEWEFGWVGRYLVQPPNGHRLHHHVDPAIGGCNFGLMPLWDHVFGTWRETPKAAYALGVDHPYRDGAGTFGDMWRDYRDFWSDVLGGVRDRR